MAGNETLGASFSIDVTDLKAGLAQANRMIRESESEFKAAAAGMDDWSSSQDGLNAKIKSLNQITDIQQKKVNALQKEYDRLIADGLDPTSKQAVVLRTKINNETTALNKNKKELEKQTKALDELGDSSDDAGKEVKDLGDNAKESGGKLDGLKGIAKGVVGAIAAVGAACVAAVGSFLSLAESTRHARTQMAKLETGFTEAGLTADDASNTFKEMFSILGDEDKATETTAFLAKIADDEKELAAATHTLTGIYATFGDALPLEGLTEAINHTASLGSVQGNLADALEWSGVNVDDFNAQLALCSDEEERQSLIMSTLAGIYDSAGTKYKEVNADVIESQRAQAELNETLNELGAIAEPTMTTIKKMTTQLLKSITPFVSLIGEGLKGALEGNADAARKLSEGLSGILTTVVDKITAALPTALGAVATMLPSLIGAITSALPTIVNAVVTVIPQVTQALLKVLRLLINCVVQIITSLLNSLGRLLPQIVTQIIEIIPNVIDSLIAAIPLLLTAAIQFLTAIIDAIPTIIEKLLVELPRIIDTIITGLLDALPQLLDAAIELLMSIVEAIPTIIDLLIENLPSIIDTIINAVLDALPQLLDAAITLFFALIDAIPTIIAELYKRLPEIVVTIISSLAKAIPKVLSTAKEIFGKIITAIGDLIKKLPSKCGEIISGIVTGLKKGISKIKDIGGDIIKGLWNGIKDMTSWITDKIKGFGESILGGIKDFFGIHSPSKVMADQVGKNLALGIGEGFEDNIGAINDEITDAMNLDEPSGRGAGGVTVYQTNNYSQAHSRYEIYKSKKETEAAVRLAMGV